MSADRLKQLETQLAEAVLRAERAERAARPLEERPTARDSQMLEVAAEELGRAERLMRAVFVNASDALFLLNDDGAFVDANPAACELLHLSRATILRRKFGAFAERAEQASAGFATMRATGQAQGRVNMTRVDGEQRIVEFHLTRNIGTNLHLSVVRDVTNEALAAESLARSEAELRRSDARFRIMVEKSGEAIALFSHDGRVLYATRHTRDLIGVDPEELVGTSSFDWVLAEDRPVAQKAVTKLLVTGSVTAEIRVRHRDGSVRWIEVIATNLLDDPSIGALVANVRDVTSRNEAARERERLIESLSFERRRAQAQFNGIPVPTYAWQHVEKDGKRDFILADYNQAAIDMSNGGIARFRGAAASEVFATDPLVFRDLERCIDEAISFRREFDADMKTTEGRRRFLATYSFAPPDLVLAHTEDVSDRRQLEEQLRQAQKMEAVGRLAGGVAHDFNNLLSVVLSYTSLAMDDLSSDHPLYGDLSEVHQAGKRAVELTHQLLAFSRQQVLQPSVMSISETVLGVERMLRRLLREDIELVLHTTTHTNIEADRGQIEQVIMNLVINARDAMPDGGLVVVETSEVTGPVPGASSRPRAEDGHSEPPTQYVQLTVRDTGKGMDEATRARVFEPFFTTKGPGQGTGLGLATVFGIVQQSGGTIQVESEPGSGTTFRLHFPASRRSAAAVGSPSARPVTRGGNETILVVEDQESLRTLAVTVLRRAGYDVLEAADGEAGAALAESFAQPIHLLLTDVVMPRMNGRALADRVTRVRPDTKVLFMSGYTDDALVLDRISESKVAFLQKPITPPVLLDKVRDVLDAVEI